MPTLQELITGVREYIGNPPYDRVTLSTICLQMYDQIDYLLNMLNLTEQNWIVNRKEFTCDTINDEYQMPADFGRPIVVENIDDGSTPFLRREVQIINYQDFNLFVTDYRTSGVYQGPTEVASVCCVFTPQDKPFKYIKLAPMPQVAVSYRVWYEVNRQVPPILSEKPRVQEQFHNLLKVLTAITVLPLCNYNEQTFSQYMTSLTGNFDRFFETFNRYIHQNHVEDTGPRRAFNSSRRYGGW